MNNRLNYSTLEDAWGSLIDNNTDTDTVLKGSSIKESTIKNNFTYKKPTNNILDINTNEVPTNDIGSVEVGANEIPRKQMIETFESRLNPCTLIDNHMNHCDSCKNKFLNKIDSKIGSKIRSKIESKINIKHRDADTDAIEHYGSFEDIKETFDNITHSQKNLLVIIIYGILIILISDLIIKE